MRAEFEDGKIVAPKYSNMEKISFSFMGVSVFYFLIVLPIMQIMTSVDVGLLILIGAGIHMFTLPAISEIYNITLGSLLSSRTLAGLKSKGFFKIETKASGFGEVTEADLLLKPRTSVGKMLEPVHRFFIWLSNRWIILIPFSIVLYWAV